MCWSLLRVPAVPQAPTGDVDLVVRTGDLAGLRTVLAEHGFVPLPGWEAPPRLLFLSYHRESANCLLLDVTDEVCFGPGGVFRTELAGPVLERSVSDAGMRVPHPDDAFWALLLHCLLDKGFVPPHYQLRLTELAAAASQTGPFARLLDDRSPPGCSAARLRAAAAAADWAQLDAAAPAWAHEWRGSLGWLARSRPLVRTGRRLLRSPGLLRRRYGVSVALLGPDGAGKSTLAAGIEQAWPLAVRRVYMGLWKSGPPGVPELPGLAQLGRVPTAWLRYLRGSAAQLRGHLVVFDRYVHDARRPPQPPHVALKVAYMWLLARCIPAPDLVLLLDLPGSVSSSRKKENSLAQADREQREYRALAGQLPHTHVLDASADAEQVRRQALEIIWQRCTRRWAQNNTNRIRPGTRHRSAG